MAGPCPPLGRAPELFGVYACIIFSSPDATIQAGTKSPGVSGSSFFRTVSRTMRTARTGGVRGPDCPRQFAASTDRENSRRWMNQSMTSFLHQGRQCTSVPAFEQCLGSELLGPNVFRCQGLENHFVCQLPKKQGKTAPVQVVVLDKSFCPFTLNIL